MPLKKPRYRVQIDHPDTDPTDHDVEILYGDQLRAELEGPRHGLTKVSDAPMHFTALWVWAALTRTGVIDDKFQPFKDRLLALEPIQDDDLEDGIADQDPTTAGPTASP